MADTLRVQKNDRSEYRVPIRVEGRLVNALIDTGMTSPDCLIGVGLAIENFAAVRSSLRGLRRIAMEGVGTSEPELVLGGLGTVAIEGIDGSELETYVAEIGDNLLGVCYFHGLRGFEVVWDLEGGEMTIARRSS